MQNVTWQDLIQLGIMLGTWMNITCMIYFNTKRKK